MESVRPDSGVPADATTTRAPLARGGLGCIVAGYVGLFTYWTVRNHRGFGTFGFDLGIFDQGTWLLSRFKEPFVTVRGLHLFGDHTSFILIFLAPFYWIASTPVTLLVAQSVALGMAAVPAFLVARDQLRDEWLALGVAVAYLAHPAVSWTNMEQFHPDVFEVPLIFLAFWLVLRQRWIAYWICVAALLLVKEDVALLTLAIGAWLAFRSKGRAGLATVGVSLMWLLATLTLIIPAFNKAGPLYGNRLPFGGIGGTLRTSLTRPWTVLRYALGPDRPFYVFQLLAPLGMLPLLSPSTFLVAALPIGVNVLSTFWYQYHLHYHYSTLIVPVLVVASIIGIARVPSKGRRQLLVAFMVLSSLVSGWYWGASQFSREPAYIGDPDTEYAMVFREAIKLIPKDAVISVNYSVVPHVAHRAEVYEFPNPWYASNWGDASQEGQRLARADRVEYVLVSRDVSADSPQRPVLAELERSGEFKVIYEQLGIVLLRRVMPHATEKNGTTPTSIR